MPIIYPTITSTEKKLIPLTTIEFQNVVAVSGTSPSYVTTIYIPPQNFYNSPNGRYDLYFVASVTGSSANITGAIGVPGLFTLQFPFRDPFSIGGSISGRKVTGFDIGYDSSDISDTTPSQYGLSVPIYASGSAADVTCSIYQAYMIKQS